MNLVKYIFLIAVAISCVSCATAPVVAKWWVYANGNSGELDITSVDAYAIFIFIYIEKKRYG
jgi:hypothetical protein